MKIFGQHDVAVVAAKWNVKQRGLVRRNGERAWAWRYEPAHLRDWRRLPGCEIEKTDRGLGALNLGVRNEVYASRREGPLPEIADFGQRRDGLLLPGAQIESPDPPTFVAL